MSAVESRSSPEWRLAVAAQTDVGRVRRNNEDAYLVSTLGSLPDGQPPGLFSTSSAPLLLAVSDGMGGARAGEVASALVLESLRRSLPAAATDWETSLVESIERANREVWAAAQAPEVRGMGATLTAVCVLANEAHIAEVGDSRAYLIRRGQAELLTHDQSYVQMMVDTGLVTPEAAAVSPMKHILLEAMGQKPDVRVEVGRVALQPNDCLLICSDGLSNELTAEEIGAAVGNASPEVACDRLIERANAHGGRDNITVIVARLETEPGVARTMPNEEPPRPSLVVEPRSEAANGWLNRTIWGTTVTSLLSDLGHEAQSTLLPSFMAGLGLPPIALGVVEGTADAAASFVKLGAGWLSDRLGIRKAFVVAGYFATGLASGVIALAQGLPMVLGGKLVGWLGRGVRGPLRDAILADTIPVGARGRAFGFHRFGDTIGAVLGPLAAGMLLARMGGASSLTTVRSLIAWSAVPGVLAAVVFWVLVRERNRTRHPARSFRHAMRNLPKDFRRYLVGVGLFGLGDYAHTMLILAAVQLLTPLFGALKAAAAGAALYTMHNAVYAVVTYPTGVLADRVGHRRILGVGYAISVGVPVLLIGCFVGHWGLPALIAAFAVAGLVNGIQDTLEAAATAELVPETDRALGFGVLGAVNGVGDLVSSLMVGGLWTVEPALGFGYAAVGMAAGALVTLAGAGDHRAYDGSR